MILKASQRSGAKDLALHLMKDENDHVDVHELRGFASETLLGALNEVYALSRGTRCRQYLFSLSLNPPPEENVPTDAFESVIERIEEQLGLSGQPRAIVFHEKEGRRHAHAVWSRINVAEMKAVQLSFTHKKLQTISRELYLEHGWQMPKGLIESRLHDPRNFTLAEWQQAKRQGKDPKEIKAALQDAWAISDSKAAFEQALQERGFALARGDRRGFVAVDYEGEVYSLPRWIGVKTKEVRGRLGTERDLDSVANVNARMTEEMLPAYDRLQDELKAELRKAEDEYHKRRQALVVQQCRERQELQEKIEQRRIEEAKIRQGRFRTGLKGLWDWMRGEHKRIREQNEQESRTLESCDRREIEKLIERQIRQRRAIKIPRFKSSDAILETKLHIKKQKISFANNPSGARRKNNLSRR